MKCEICKSFTHIIYVNSSHQKVCDGCHERTNMITIKNFGILRVLMERKYHHKLVSLLEWSYNNVIQLIYMTSAFREGDNGVHGTTPCRGLDLRSHGLENPQALCDKINKAWIYDPKRPDKVCAIFHDVGQGEHIHLQVHPNTVMVN